MSSVGNCSRAKWKTAGSEIRAPPRVRTPDDIIPRFPLASELLRHSRIDARVESISDRPAYRCIGLRWGDFRDMGVPPAVRDAVAHRDDRDVKSGTDELPARKRDVLARVGRSVVGIAPRGFDCFGELNSVCNARTPAF